MASSVTNNPPRFLNQSSVVINEAGYNRDKIQIFLFALTSTQNPPVIAIYPGSFDPITLGHLDIIERGSRLFEGIIVAVLCNPQKSPLFPVPHRLVQIQHCTQHLSNVTVESFSGLTVDYARLRQAGAILRGLRVLSDFEKELQMAHTNTTLCKDLETIFLATSTEYSFLSSSVVKEIAQFGGSVDHLVPVNVAQDIYRCFNKTPPVVTLNTTIQ